MSIIGTAWVTLDDGQRKELGAVDDEGRIIDYGGQRMDLNEFSGKVLEVTYDGGPMWKFKLPTIEDGDTPENPGT